jgi:predicted nucleic acid-binding protein
MALVVDASLTMAWCFEDEATPETDEILARVVAEGAVVPSLWPYEVGNVLALAERRQRLTASQSARFAALLAALPITVETMTAAPELLAAAARQHGLTAYDAAYVATAQRHGLPLATTDTALARAARQAGLVVLPETPSAR